MTNETFNKLLVKPGTRNGRKPEHETASIWNTEHWNRKIP